MKISPPLLLRSNSIILAVIVIVSLTACSPSVISWTNPEFKPHEFKNIVVFGMFQRLDMRMAFEDELAVQLANRGHKSGLGLNIIPPSFEVKSGKQMQTMIRDAGFEMVIMVSLADSKEKMVYHHDSYSGAYGGAYGPYDGYGMYNYYNYRYGYGVGYGGYGTGWQDRGHYEAQTTYYLESKIFDLSSNSEAGEDMIYAGAITLTESSSMNKLGEKYSLVLLKSLKDNKILQ